jgi:hypothetical protein
LPKAPLLNQLTTPQLKAAVPGNRLLDGGGLRLDVDSNGNKSWIFRFKSPVTGKERYMGLGSFPTISLSDARMRRDEARSLLGKHIDPINHRNQQRATAKIESARAITFKMYAEQFIGGREATWRNPKHRQQWRNSLRDHA